VQPELKKNQISRIVNFIFYICILCLVLTFAWAYLEYLDRKHRTERKKQFIESAQLELNANPQFNRVGLDLSHVHFISVTGIVEFVEQQKMLEGIVSRARSDLGMPAVLEVKVVTNLNQ
jgi:hypothetical protein